MKVEVFVMAIMVMCICPGRVSGEKDLLQEDERHLRYCRYPRGKPGAVRSHGCIQSICTHGKWTTKMRTDICCYKQKAHEPNTILETIVGTDNCSSTTIGCGAVAQLEINHHSSCSTPSSKQQVEEFKINMEQKIETVTEKIETLENKMESLAQTVNDNYKDQTELSQTIMRTLANLTGLMEKQAEEKAPCATNTPATTNTPAAPTTTTPMVEGVLITGGSGVPTSTELYLPGTGRSCSLQSLPDSRYWHSLNNVAGETIICGGGSGSSRTSCLQFLTNSSTGSWADYAILAEGRYGHTSHSFQGQLMLSGGTVSRRTTEIVGEGAKYDLNQDTRYACSIPDQSSYILTGGVGGSGYLNSVVQYNFQGYVADLPDLDTARYGHGCGYYLYNGNNKVMVVAGGTGSSGAYLSSTETLSAGASAWTSGDSLPRTLAYTMSLNIGNYLLLIGGYNGGYRGEVLKFNGTWAEVGMLKTGRSSAAATKIEIPANGILDISACN